MSSVVIPPPDRIQADVEHLKDWIGKEPHLPSIDDEEWLKTFLYNNKFSLEKTKFKLDNLYSLRTKYPEYFTNRDPTGADLVKLRPLLRLCEGHKLMRDGSKVIHIKYAGDPGALEPPVIVKKLTMYWDHWCLDPANRLINLVLLFDASDIKPMYALKALTVLPVIVEIFDKAYTFRVKSANIINYPPFTEKLHETAMNLLPTKLSERFHLHKSTDTLFQMVDEDVVSCDLGGKGLSFDDLEDQTLKKLEQTRGWFKEQENVCSNEALRREDSNQLEEMRGSFRKLDVD